MTILVPHIGTVGRHVVDPLVSRSTDARLLGRPLRSDGALTVDAAASAEGGL